jgi:hypothetical protein
MSAQQRYLTLVQHISKIYAADDGGIDELTDGLKDILTHINPTAASDWKKVQSDSKRLLRIWHSRADDSDAAADEVVDQIADSLKEFSTGEIQLIPIIEAPTLIVSEIVPPAPVYKTVTLTASAEEEEEEVEEVEEEEEEEEETSIVVVVKKVADNDTRMLIDAEEEEEEDEEEEEEIVAVGGSAPMDIIDDAAAAAVVVTVKPTKEEEEEVIEPTDDEEEAEEEAEAAPEVEEEVEEEAEEEVEEEGMEVEKRVIRGRPYWIDINTNKLYAVIGDDDVGDEVGAIINGKSVFRAA